MSHVLDDCTCGPQVLLHQLRLSLRLLLAAGNPLQHLALRLRLAAGKPCGPFRPVGHHPKAEGH